MKCQKCRFDNPEGAKFCNECGSRLTPVCPECGKVNPPESKFCNECGHDLTKSDGPPPVDFDQPRSYTPKHLVDKILNTRSSVEGERKLVTVLFADVADYTAISENLDPEEVHQIMDGCFKILMDEIHTYEGTINQFTGDGVMALFGAPVAHEDHAQTACHAALAIQKALEGYGRDLERKFGLRFQMRMGLNSGPVVVGSIGDDLRMDYTALGDTTNLAARMEGMAKPGTILGTAYTHKLTRDFFEFEPLGRVRVKGKREPQEVYELVKTSSIETRIEAAAVKGLTRFVGRTVEAQTLREAYEKARFGSGQVVGIVGEAGVGKSRLLIELRKMLFEGEYTYLEGRCVNYGGAMAYLPILDILRSYFDIKEGDPEFDVKKKIGEAIEDLYSDHLEEYYELLAYHYTMSDNAEKALEYLDLAHQKAANVTAMEEAATYFDEAMKLLDSLPDTEVNNQRRISLLIDEWVVSFLLFRTPEYYKLLTRYEPVAVGLDNPKLLGAYLTRMAQCEWWPGHFDQAIERGEKAAELCEAAGNFEAAGFAYLAMQWSHLFKGDLHKVMGLKEDILRLSKEHFSLRPYVWAFCAASWACEELGLWDEAVQEGQEAMRVAEEFSDNSMISFVALVLSTAYTMKGDLARGIEYAELSVQRAQTPADKVWAQSALALPWIKTGEIRKGIELLAELVPMYRAVGYDAGQVHPMLSLAKGYLLAKEYENARQTLEECLKLAERCRMKVGIAVAHRLLGEVALETDPVHAGPHFEKSIALLQQIKAENELAKAYAGYGRFYREQDNITRAREYLAKAREIFERLGTLMEPEKVKEALGELSEGGL